ncbi:MAG: hypothetical protein KY442_09485 [Proteobacteria bacterium]|nr:hypothetical protein [Pseudomonadota bacterium]
MVVAADPLAAAQVGYGSEARERRLRRWSLTGPEHDRSAVSLRLLPGLYAAHRVRVPDSACDLVDLTPDAETPDFDEAAAVGAAGLAYVNLPLRGPSDLTRETVLMFDALMCEAQRPMLVHCASGNRVVPSQRCATTGPARGGNPVRMTNQSPHPEACGTTGPESRCACTCETTSAPRRRWSPTSPLTPRSRCACTPIVTATPSASSWRDPEGPVSSCRRARMSAMVSDTKPGSYLNVRSSRPTCSTTQALSSSLMVSGSSPVPFSVAVLRCQPGS